MAGGSDPAPLLAGALLLLAFLALFRRREGAAVPILAAGGAVLGLAALWGGTLGATAGSPGLLAMAALSLLPRAVGVPLLYRALLRGEASRAAPRLPPRLGTGARMVAGLALVGLAVLLVLPVTAPGADGTPVREALALSLSTLFLGLLLAALRRDGAGRALGLLVAEWGIALAALELPALPEAAPLTALTLLLATALAAGAMWRPGRAAAGRGAGMGAGAGAEMGAGTGA